MMSAEPHDPGPSGSDELGLNDPASRHEPHARLLLEYWKAKCGPHGLPGRGQIDPVEMRSFLPCTVLLDVERHDGWFRFRYRLAGTQVVRMFGREVTGRYVDELNSAPAQAIAQHHLAAPVRSLQAASGRALAPPSPRHRDCLYLFATVPLASDGVTVDMLMGIRCPLPAPGVWRVHGRNEGIVRVYL